MKKFLLLSVVAAVLVFAAGNVRAELGVVTITGSATLQTNDAHASPLMKTQSVALKDIFTIIEQGNGDTSLTNKHVTTKLYYDPDAVDNEAYDSLEGQGFGGTLPSFTGVFYYSNSVSGKVQLDGQDPSSGGDYYSYIELDYYDAYSGPHGFWNSTAMEAGSAYTESDTGLSFKSTGNAILYVHSNPYSYDLVGLESNTPAYYYANDSVGSYNPYAITMHGNTASTWSYNGAGTLKETLKLAGSGDVIWGGAGSGAFSKGTFSFSGQGGY